MDAAADAAADARMGTDAGAIWTPTPDNCAAPDGGTPDAVSPVVPDGGPPRVTTFDRSDVTGAVVTVTDLPSITITSADGTFAWPPVPDGQYAVTIAKNGWEETIPKVQVSGGAPFIVDTDGRSYPLTTIELQQAHRLVAGTTSTVRFDTAPAGVVYALYDPNGAGFVQLVTPTGDTTTTLDTGFDFQAFFVEGGAKVVVARGTSILVAADNELVLFDPSLGSRRSLTTQAAVGTVFRLGPERVTFGWSGNSPTPGALGLSRLDVGDTITAPTYNDGWSISRDGVWMASYWGTTFGLQLINVTTGAVRLISVPSLSTFDVSSDGKYLVYSNQVSTFSVPTAGGTPTSIASVRDHLLSPDGSVVVYQPNISSPLQAVPVGGGTPRVITVDVLTASLGTCRFSSDGAFLFFETINAFKAASTAALDVQIVTTQSNPFLLDYAPARRTAYVLVDTPGHVTEHDILRMPLDHTGPAVPIATGMTSISAWTVSPSGRFLLFAQPDPVSGRSILTLVDTATDSVQRLAYGNSGAATFSPDESWLLFADDAGWARLGRTSDGATFPVAANGSAFGAVFSPSGDRVLFGAAGGLAVAPVAPCPVPVFIARNGSTSNARWVGNRAVAFFRERVAPPFAFANGYYLAQVP